MERVQNPVFENLGAVLAPSASFLPMLCASEILGQHWRLMLSHFSGILWKNTINTKEKIQFLGCVAVGFCCYLLVGMLHLGYACLISGLCWAIVGYVGTILGSC